MLDNLIVKLAGREPPPRRRIIYLDGSSPRPRPTPDISDLLQLPLPTAELLIPSEAASCVAIVSSQACEFVHAAFRDNVLKGPSELWTELHRLRDSPPTARLNHIQVGQAAVVTGKPLRMSWPEIVDCLRKPNMGRFKEIDRNDKWAAVRETDLALDILAGSVGKDGMPQDMTVGGTPPQNKATNDPAVPVTLPKSTCEPADPVLAGATPAAGSLSEVPNAEAAATASQAKLTKSLSRQKPKRVRGRKCVPKREELKRLKICEGWAAATAKKTLDKKEFCVAEKIDLPYLDTCLDWDAKRRVRIGENWEKMKETLTKEEFCEKFDIELDYLNQCEALFFHMKHPRIP